MILLGLPVIYFPHAEHDHLKQFAETGLAAVIGRVHETGSVDLFVLVPGKEAHWADNVRAGEGPHTFRNIAPPEQSEPAAEDNPAPPVEPVVATNVTDLRPGAPPIKPSPGG